MNEITIITTYYNNKSHLENFINRFIELRKEEPSFKLIVVDDGSMIYPAIDVFDQYDNLENISLYRITKDLGFNSHGARNLGMTVSTTEWNLLTDSDIDLPVYQIENFIYQKIDKDDVYSFTTNSILIHKETFFTCKGYDEDFVNIHYGDRFFINFLKKYFNFIKLKGNNEIDKLRGEWKVKFSKSHSITTYDEKRNILYQPVIENAKEITDKVKERYSSFNFDKKKILNFEWKKINLHQ